MTLTDLQQRAIDLVDAQQYIEARPYLLELVTRFQNEDEEVKRRLEAVYFYLGVGYLVEYGGSPSNELLEQGISWFDRLEKEFPNGNFAIVAGLATADAYRGLQQWKKAAEVYTKLLSPPLEGRMNGRQIVEALKKISQSYYILRDWTAGEPWFRRLLSESLDTEDQAMAAAALMEGYITQGKFQEAISLFPYLVGETPSRYHLQLNVAMIDAGDRLAKAHRYGEAMLMYRMVLTVEEIIRWQTNRLANLESQLSLLRLTTTGDTERSMQLETDIFNTNAQLTALKEMRSYTPELRVRIARNYLLTGRDWESFWAYKVLIEDYPNHENIEDFIYAAFTGAVNIGMVDEVIRLGESYLNNPRYSTYRNDIIVRLAQFYLERDRIDDFFAIAKRFIEQNPEDRYCSQIIFLMGSTFVKLEDFEGMIELFQQYIKDYPGTLMQDGLHYWTGMGYLFYQDYEKALPYFETVLSQYGVGAYAEDALYRKGICLFGLQDINQARQTFQLFVKEYPTSAIRGEAEYFLGDIEAAAPNVEAALKHYANVEQFTNNHAFIENAYFRAGELLEVNRRYEEMVAQFERYISKFEGQGDMTAAIYQLGRARELQDRPGDMLRVYWGAVSRYGNNPQTYGLDAIIEEYPVRYESNRRRIEENLTFLERVVTDTDFRKLLAADRMALFNYIAQNPAMTEDVKRPFYDRGFRLAMVDDPSPVQPLLNKYRTMRDDMPKETPVEQFRITYEEAKAEGKPTLLYRMQQGLWEQGVDVNPGQVFTEEDFAFASPSSLIWMSERNREFDVDLGRMALKKVITHHQRSELLLRAFLNLGDLEMAAGNYDAALASFREAEARFPGRIEIMQAILSMGDVYMLMDLPVEAREQYERVLNNRAWRGEAHAEALFKIGQTYQATGNLDMAQAFFERTYIGHAAFTQWSGAAYLESGRVLNQMGNRQDAIRTYDEFLNTPEFEGTQYFTAIQNARAAL